VQKCLVTAIYAVYVVSCIGFTTAITVRFKRLSRIASGAKRALIKAQIHFVVVTVACCISHSIKAAFQVYLFNLTLRK
ncbi:hypothetical protein PRIPAC_82737, partial [Pristionchus pacificus]|uniref:Uncharacterized protein n=1 Tax=Pristionchus pacificus TaxID=54126 RepID=A0A2A6C474_PRIPA